MNIIIKKISEITPLKKLQKFTEYQEEVYGR